LEQVAISPKTNWQLASANTPAQIFMQILKYARTIPCVCLSADTKDNSIGNAILTDSKNKNNVIFS